VEGAFRQMPSEYARRPARALCGYAYHTLCDNAVAITRIAVNRWHENPLSAD